MARQPAPLTPRRILVGGQVRWEVRIPVELRKQEAAIRRRFIKEQEAKGFCNRLKSDLVRYSDKARGLTDQQKMEAQECFARLVAHPGTTLTRAVDLFLERLNHASKSFPVSELADRVIRDKERQGGHGSSERLIREIRERFARFSRVFGHRMVSEIEPREVRDWLLALTTIVETSEGKRESGEPVSQATRQAYKRTLSIGFGWAKEHQAAPVNPVAEVKLAHPARERVFIFTPPQTAVLLRSAHPDLRPYLALCCFAGLRPEQAQRLSWDHIHFDRGDHGEIEVPVGTDKTEDERIVPIQPNLRAWLFTVPETKRCGTVHFSRQQRRDAYMVLQAVDSSLPDAWPQDAPRHGYGTYRLKITGSFGQVADEMGNSEDVIRSRYYRSVSAASAEAYWSILPSENVGD